MHVIEYHAFTTDYLAPHLESLRRYSPNTQIHLIGDEIVSNEIQGCVSSKPYHALVEKLNATFVNHSPNPPPFELVCLQRWFIIYNYAKYNNIRNFWSFDRDVLVFTNLNSETELMRDTPMSLPLSTFYCENAESLKPWLDWILDIYSNHGTLESIMLQIAEKRMFNISDMNLAFWYWRHNLLLRIPGSIQGTDAWDANLTLGEHGFELVDGSKLLRFTMGYPEAYNAQYVRWMRMKTLHCHGSHKNRMHEYLTRAETRENTVI